MAVNKMPQGSKLIIKVQTGLNAAGNPVYRQRTYANLKASAVDADIFAIGNGIGGLQKYPVSNILRNDESELVNG